jgi:hypothetical protein
MERIETARDNDPAERVVYDDMCPVRVWITLLNRVIVALQSTLTDEDSELLLRSPYIALKEEIKAQQ